ncbi:MAG: flagellar biosynthesis repressor FlbT [Beijerinckiaceae bacterium]|nr:flagellar biosynthesis repressor FlbT [Beijerinckiaceae bacterium]
MNLRLRAGEKIYLNGAVVRFDRKVSIEILNDVSFLLEGHVLQASDATTPLRQLYFVVQSALIGPANSTSISALIRDMLKRTVESFSNREVLYGLFEVSALLDRSRFFDCLRIIRSLYEIEADVFRAQEQGDFRAA